MLVKKDVLTVDDVAALLKIGKKTVYKLAKSDQIPVIRVGGTWRFYRDSLEKYLRGESRFNHYRTNNNVKPLDL